MATKSRLAIDPITNLPSINTFGELSNFLRSSVADEDCRQLSEGMAQLSALIEVVIATLRVNRSRSTLAPMLMDLLTGVREHRQLVVNLGLSWRGLYEYPAYLQALNHFRVLIGQWLLQGGAESPEIPLTPEDFQLVAWRTIGEGMLLIDMYEQWLASDKADGASTLGETDPPKVERAVQWWKRLGR
jgi:hypothetical protein